MPASGTESRSSVTSSPDGIRRSTGSAATVPASTTTLTVTIGSSFSVRHADGSHDARHRRGPTRPVRDCRRDRAGRRPTLDVVADGVIDDRHRMAGQRELNAVYLLDGRRAGARRDRAGRRRARRARRRSSRSASGRTTSRTSSSRTSTWTTRAAPGRSLGRFPRATVWVHERGAPHLVDPTRLVASTARTYGEERMRALLRRDRARCRPSGSASSPTATRSRSATGRSRSSTRPGHASHHVALARRRDRGDVHRRGDRLATCRGPTATGRRCRRPRSTSRRRSRASSGSARGADRAADLALRPGRRRRARAATRRRAASATWSDAVRDARADTDAGDRRSTEVPAEQAAAR